MPQFLIQLVLAVEFYLESADRAADFPNQQNLDDAHVAELLLRSAVLRCRHGSIQPQLAFQQ